MARDLYCEFLGLWSGVFVVESGAGCNETQRDAMRHNEMRQDGGEWQPICDAGGGMDRGLRGGGMRGLRRGPALASDWE